jgi:hypothetical protein
MADGMTPVEGWTWGRECSRCGVWDWGGWEAEG